MRVIKRKGNWSIYWHANNKIGEFQVRIEIHRPFLKQTVWPPMTGMLIPGVLEGADELIVEISNYEGPEKEQKEALLKEITDLRKEFRVGLQHY